MVNYYCQPFAKYDFSKDHEIVHNVCAITLISILFLLKKFMKKFDADGDGNITEEEYLRVVCNLPAEDLK